MNSGPTKRAAKMNSGQPWLFLFSGFTPTMTQSARIEPSTFAAAATASIKSGGASLVSTLQSSSSRHRARGMRVVVVTWAALVVTVVLALTFVQQRS
jgi:hypothetical protein